ncbi:MAG: TRASH domain-containing protein [Pedosphaera sp.]|nr:TRASH domain-containing protein [Pedosphaera sp.]
MKSLKLLTLSILVASVLVTPWVTQAADAKADKKKYPLTTCIVSDEKLGGDMGDAYIHKHEGKEVQLCCKSCLKDFKKSPAPYMKKLAAAEKKAAK